MVKSCCVVGCKNIWQPNSNITYHKFPLNDETRFAQWMLIDELRDIKVTPTKRICSAHFTTQSFEEHCVVKRLKKDAVPSIFGDTLHMDDISREAVDILEEVHIDNMCEKQINVLDKSTSTEKNMHVSVQTSCIYFEDRKKILYLRKKVKILQQQLKRRNSRIVNMQKIIHHLTDKTDKSLNKKDVCKVSRTDLCSNWKEHSYCSRIT
ncbi:unnamed protein product [Lasius platythorax]|uniref:THAP-type domain-containing protein n=1 Tax=Lasius platythorax TaxID=488582 RepID=A0AAV2P3I9_9HYME